MQSSKDRDSVRSDKSGRASKRVTMDTDMFDTMVETPTLRYASITLSNEGKAVRGSKKGKKGKD